MIRPFSLFVQSLFCPFANLFPHRKQQLLELLEEIAEEAPCSPCCEDLLEFWLEQFGGGGLLLGNIALFFIGLVLMIGVDLLVHHSGGVTAVIAGAFSIVYSALKFRTGKPMIDLAILVFSLYWMLCGFWWSIGFVFLVYFTNIGVRYVRRR